MDYHVLKEVPVDLNIEKFELDAMYGRGLLKQIAPRYWGTYFGHTMEGGYTAGYYSYIWAEVLDCDAFEAFKETGDIFSPEVAAKFRTYVLSPGGIDEGMIRKLRIIIFPEGAVGIVDDTDGSHGRAVAGNGREGK